MVSYTRKHSVSNPLRGSSKPAWDPAELMPWPAKAREIGPHVCIQNAVSNAVQKICLTWKPPSTASGWGGGTIELLDVLMQASLVQEAIPHPLPQYTPAERVDFHLVSSMRTTAPTQQTWIYLKPICNSLGTLPYRPGTSTSLRVRRLTFFKLIVHCQIPNFQNRFALTTFSNC